MADKVNHSLAVKWFSSCHCLDYWPISHKASPYLPSLSCTLATFPSQSVTGKKDRSGKAIFFKQNVWVWFVETSGQTDSISEMKHSKIADPLVLTNSMGNSTHLETEVPKGRSFMLSIRLVNFFNLRWSNLFWVILLLS